jgi:PHP family Zn ribbon phosphoesterase
MMPAIVAGAVFASLAAIVITFFRRVHRLQGAIASLQDVQKSSLPSQGKANTESSGVGKGGGGILTTCSHCEFGFFVGASAATVACPKCGNVWRMGQYPRL